MTLNEVGKFLHHRGHYSLGMGSELYKGKQAQHQ